MGDRCFQSLMSKSREYKAEQKEYSERHYNSDVVGQMVAIFVANTA